ALLQRDQLGLAAGLLDRLQRLRQLDLLDTVGEQKRHALAFEFAGHDDHLLIRSMSHRATRPRWHKTAVHYAWSMLGLRLKTTLVDPAQALPGRADEMPVADRHAVLGTPLKPPFPEGFEQVVVGMGCFWGAERVFWQAPGVYTTAVGYAGGFTPNPTYEEVCSGRTGHTEAVLVVFDPAKTSYEEILRLFWENHDP